MFDEVKRATVVKSIGWLQGPIQHLARALISESSEEQIVVCSKTYSAVSEGQSNSPEPSSRRGLRKWVRRGSCYECP